MGKELSIIKQMHNEFGGNIFIEIPEEDSILSFLFPNFEYEDTDTESGNVVYEDDYSDLTNKDNLLTNVKKELLIFQDIISIWFRKRIEGNTQNEFDITQIGNYLLKNNIYLVDEFKGEHIPFSNRLQKKRSFIEKRVKLLKNFDILQRSTNKKSSKKNQKLEKDVYEFTLDGKIISWLMACKREDSESAKYVEILAFDIFDLLLHMDSGLSTRLIIDYFKLAMKENQHKLVIEFFEHVIDYINFQHLYELRLWFLRLISQSGGDLIFKKVIDSYDKKTRELALFQIKMDLECSIGLFMHGEFKNDWEIRRYQNVENPYIITNVGRCMDCNSDIAETVDLLSFIGIEKNSRANLLRCSKCTSNNIFDLTFFDLFESYDNMKDTIKTIYAVI